MPKAKKQKTAPTSEQLLAQIDTDEIALHCLLRDDPVAFARIACGFKPHAKQIEVLTSPLESLKLCLPWSRRFGKSKIISVYLCWRLFSKPKYTSYIFGPTGEQSKNLWTMICDTFESSPYLQRYAKYRIVDNCITVGGANWNSTCTWKKTGLLGNIARGGGIKDGNGIIVFDEIGSATYPADLTDTLKPYAATGSQGGGIVYLSSPTPKGTWWDTTVRDYEEQQKLGSKRHKVIRCKWTDVSHVDRDFVMEEKREAEKHGRLHIWEREYMGEFTDNVNAFFDADDIRNCHVTDLSRGGKSDLYIYSLDPSIDKNPSCLLVARYNQILSRLEIIDCRLLARYGNEHIGVDDGVERIESYEEIVDLILDLRKNRPIHSMYIDPATEKNIGERLKNTFHINVIDCRISSYPQKLTALRDLQSSLGSGKIVWEHNAITTQLTDFCPAISPTTNRYVFPESNYDIISAMCGLNRFIGDRQESVFYCSAATRRAI